MKSKPQMDGMNADELHVEKTERIIGCCFRVLNQLGHGFHEKPYENALVVEFEHQDIPYSQQQFFPIIYRDVKVGEYIPDLIVFGRVIVDTKTIARIGDHEIGRMLNYLRIADLRVGLIVNFKRPKLEFKRVSTGKST